MKSLRDIFYGSIEFTPATFTLVGISWLEAEQIWISIPFCLMYTIIFLGNGIILHVIRIDRAFHQPMYYFLALLAYVELGVSASTMPTVLSIFLFGITDISFGSCLLQMFSMHSFIFMESDVLLAMSVDRFVAIYSPLRYKTILTIPCITGMGVAIALRSMMLMFPLLFLLKHLPFCGHKTLTHSYWLHSDLIKLPCGDTRPNSIMGLFVITSTFGLDSLLIVVSYVLILHTVLGIASGAGQWRALNTCVSHICAVLVYYVPMISLSLMHRFGRRLSPLLQTAMANVYLFFPPVVNPIVYSIKTKEIHNSIVRTLTRKRSEV
ncbi:PREDICTED: olfactory receptor 51G2-like [Propithecus coquereli]|uniref:olfactory receptor 51G2-like n=1 Tax=Propithecus coquereli TaxID=379532 RepID=UPI00063FA07D|nr:PREDICTED: olfactory receptor 51G2-like [Propithecus coquereli]